MGVETAKLIVTAIAAAILLGASCGDAAAQPTTPEPIPGHPSPPQGGIGTPVMPGGPINGQPRPPSYQSVSCRPIGTGASALNKGLEIIVGRPSLKGLPPHVFVNCRPVGPAMTATTMTFFVIITPDDQSFATYALSVAGAAHLSGKLLSVTYNENDDSVPLATIKPIVEIEMIDAPGPS
jgi:hypothetical protein